MFTLVPAQRASAIQGDLVVSTTIATGRSSIVLGSAAALGGALLGGVAWALIVKFTGYEVGFVAVAVGALTGFAAAFAAPNARPAALLAILAGAAALVGVLLGKLLATYFVIGEELADLGVSGDQLSLTMEFLQSKDAWALWDLLWIGIAVSAAFQICSSRLAEHQN
jgi:hypothetical protein